MPALLSLVVLTRPDKIRHSEIAEIEIAVSSVLSNGLADLFHNGLKDSWRHNDASLVIEQHVHVAISVGRPSHLAHGMQWASHFGNVPSATNSAMSPFNAGYTLAVLLNHLAACAGEVFAGVVRFNLYTAGKGLRVCNVAARPAVDGDSYLSLLLEGVQ